MYKQGFLGFLFAIILFPVSLISFGQTDFINRISEWKKNFPKEEVVAYSYKDVVDFNLNSNPKPGEGKVSASITTDIVLVPLKDYVKYSDGLFYNQQVSVDNVKVYNSDGKAIPVEKQCSSYSSEDIFYSDEKLCIVKFPLAEKGKAFKYSYQNNYNDIKYLTSIYFHRRLPAAERMIQFNIPSWMDIDLREFNFMGNVIEKTSEKAGDITKVTFKMKDVPGYISEPHSPNHAITYPHLICVSKSYLQNGQRVTLFENVKDLYGWYSTVCSDIGNNPDDLKIKVNDLTSNKKTDIEKIESIFYWVQDNIRYIAFEDGIMGFKPDAAQNVFKKKYGDCKGKANLLKEMLKLAGYDARLTWIGTSDLPYDYSLPSLSVDNHMICTLLLNGKKYFLDGTEDYIALNDYAQRIQGKQVLIEDGKNYILERIPQFPAERNKEIKSTRLLVDGDKLTGNGSVEYNGESKIMVQRIYASIRNENKSDVLSGFLKEGNNNVDVNNIKNSDFNERQKPLLLSFNCKNSNQITKTGNELYVVMDWSKEFSGFEMPDERKNDYEFNQKYYITAQTELQVPSGYKVDYLPAAVKKNTPDYSFEGSYVNKGKSIVYSKTIVINKPILKKSEFRQWNSFIADINKFYNDQVVLIKN